MLRFLRIPSLYADAWLPNCKIYRAMRSHPATGKDWFALLLLPFKVFVPSGYFMVLLAADNRGAVDGVVPLVASGYMVSLFALLLGGQIQHEIGPRRAYLSTCGFIVALFAFGLLLLPFLAHA